MFQDSFSLTKLLSFHVKQSSRGSTAVIKPENVYLPHHHEVHEEAIDKADSTHATSTVSHLLLYSSICSPKAFAHGSVCFFVDLVRYLS